MHPHETKGALGIGVVKAEAWQPPPGALYIGHVLTDKGKEDKYKEENKEEKYKEEK